MRTIYSLLLPLLAAFLVISGCGENPVDPSKRHITTGASHDLATQMVPSFGGTIELAMPGDSLDGLTIEVPDGAYPESRTFRVRSSAIESHDLGAAFHPITPVITIENGGGYADAPMKLTIPCTIPEGHFAMAFLYDRATGSLEGMPLITFDATSITVATSHFSFSKVASATKSSGLLADNDGSSDIIVSSIPEKDLEGTYDSGFRPGVDDWQFTNWGSCINPGGHCGGQSTTMLWYYSNRKQKRNDPPLNGRFDNDGARTTPKIWEDDVAGYRFCGVAQVELPWNTISQKIQGLFERSTPDKVTYNLFAYAIHLTGQPQFVIVNTQDSINHAVVVYKIGNGTLHIADPNYPGGTDRSFAFANGHFLPYYSGSDAANLGWKFDKFLYFAQSSIVDFDLFKQKWGQVIDESIGSDKYPFFTLTARDGSGEISALTDGFVTRTGTLKLGVVSTAPLKILKVYDDDENVVPFTLPNTIQLGYGSHLLGFVITDQQGEWAGFQWVRVESKNDGSVTPTPPVDKGTICVSWLSDDGVGQLVTHSGFERYADGRFQFYASYVVGGAQMWVNGFHGVGKYPLVQTSAGQPGGSSITYNNGSTWRGTGFMTITRWDTDSFTGTYDFESKNLQGEVAKVSYGQFQCSRQ